MTFAGFGNSLQPDLTERVVSTWRQESAAEVHYKRKFWEWTQKGCHGVALQRNCPEPASFSGFHSTRCVCNGTGRVSVDHPNRTDMP